MSFEDPNGRSGNGDESIIAQIIGEVTDIPPAEIPSEILDKMILAERQGDYPNALNSLNEFYIAQNNLRSLGQ